MVLRDIWIYRYSKDLVSLILYKLNPPHILIKYAYSGVVL
jgi:hypothetical protein